MEVLSVIAYNQPVSRSFVEQVRGVDSSSTIQTLVQKGLVEEAGSWICPAARWRFGRRTYFCARSACKASRSCRRCTPTITRSN